LRAKLLATLMKWNTLEEEPCSLARTVTVIGKLLEPVDPARMLSAQARFEAFEASLGITRHVLADPPKKLMRRIPYQESPKRYEYILTPKSLDLYPIIISIVDWGKIHMVDSCGRRTSTRTAAIWGGGRRCTPQRARVVSSLCSVFW